jgi:hypothetical protein
MSQFYISSEVPEHDLQRCHRSREFRRWLAITGATEEGEIKLFEGVVQSVEDKGKNALKKKNDTSRLFPSARRSSAAPILLFLPLHRRRIRVLRFERIGERPL